MCDSYEAENKILHSKWINEVNILPVVKYRLQKRNVYTNDQSERIKVYKLYCV